MHSFSDSITEIVDNEFVKVTMMFNAGKVAKDSEIDRYIKLNI